MNGNNDEHRQLLNEMSAGSLAAFDRFYERYVPIMYRVAVKLTGNRMDAEDVVHDVILRLIRHPERYDPARGSLESWVLVQTKSRSLDLLRQRNRQATIERQTDAMRDHGMLPEERVLAKAETESVRDALGRIPSLQREALYGAFFHSMTHRQLAEHMNRPLGTVKSLVRYGLNNVRKQLFASGWTDSPKGRRHS